MALKMVGANLIPIKEVAAPTLNVNVARETVQRHVERIDPERAFMINPVAIILAPKEVIPPVVSMPRNLSDGTIVPRFDEGVTVATIPMERVAGFVPETIYSPAPTSIFGIGAGMGTIIVSLGKAVVAEIAADVSMDTLQRIGQRVMPNARIRGRIVTADIGRHVGVRGGDLRSGWLPDRKKYDGPCNFWEFWCWLW